MTDIPATNRSRFYFSLWLPAVVLGVLLIIILVMQLSLSWQAHQRLTPITSHISHMSLLQNTNLRLQNKLVANLTNHEDFSPDERALIAQELLDVIALKSYLQADTPMMLGKAQQVLTDVNKDPRDALLQAIAYTRDVIALESAAHHKQISEVNHSTEMELKIGMIALLIFPSAGIFLIYLLRRRILAPLDHLGFLMGLLAHKDYATAPVAKVDPLLQPLTENYNSMVTRLVALEKEHEDREKYLEEQVRNATSTLLEQQRSLANTERLAAVGETMARIAHELRNPLAGIKLACANLRQDLLESNVNRDIIERIDIVVAEIDRIVTLLNTLLDQSRHKPEPLRDVLLSQLVDDLLVLVRYQLPVNVQITQQITSMTCRLPSALLCQALLNLIINASQAIGDKAGVIKIGASVENDTLYLSVSDDGPGFPDDILGSGIRTFVSHRSGGTGLGLSMVDRFVRTHNGRLILENCDPQGAKVTVELPCRSEHV